MSNQDPGDGPAKGGRRRRIALLALPVVLLAAGLVVYIQYGASFFGSPEGAEQASGVAWRVILRHRKWPPPTSCRMS
jgi:flagellar basal body-associated protein FliL